MATTYTHKKVEADYEIYRNDEHVATYDPITEDTTYTHGNDKYSTPIGKEVNKIKADIEAETPATDTEEIVEPVERTPLDGETELTNRIASICYDNYCTRVGGKAFNGDPLPNWEEFSAHPEKQLQADAWRGVGIDALEIVGDAMDRERPSQPISDVAKENKELRRYNESLKQEVNELRSAQDNSNPVIDRTPERFQDSIDESDAPVKDSRLGDLTPEYIEWARNGGMAPEVFTRRYKGRIKDLRIPEQG